MSFLDIYNEYQQIDLDDLIQHRSQEETKRSLLQDKCTAFDFLNLLTPSATEFLEEMAQKSNRITLKNFGRAIHLYTPMYLSDYCENKCIYCGFNPGSKENSKKLTLEEVETEAKYISASGLKHILILTGTSRTESPVTYIADCVKVLKKYFSSVSIEVYALTHEEYAYLIAEGVDGLTVYQEVYDKEVYSKVHLAGPKKDYIFRINAAERALNEGMRFVNIGALLGLADWRKEIFFTGLHAKYLQDKFPSSEVSVSVPRLRPCSGSFEGTKEVTDRDMVQIITALRIFLPRVGITLSTREDGVFRENALPLGVTRFSAGSTTAVGGHTLKEANVQFEIADKRDVLQIKEMLKEKGYQPVLKDWMEI